MQISAKKGTGIDELLETVLLVAEVAELRANPDKPARGTVIEAHLDRRIGPVATVLVATGTLHVGDIVACGVAYGKVSFACALFQQYTDPLASEQNASALKRGAYSMQALGPCTIVCVE